MTTAADSVLYERYTSTHYAEHQTSDEVVFRGYDLNFGPLLPASPDARIIDVGCGMGYLLRFLAKRGYRNAEGVDISAEQVEACRKSGLSSVSRVEDPAQFLSTRAGTYDMIIMTDVLEHIPKPQVIPLLQAIYKALKPGGKAVFRVPNLAAFGGVVRRYYDFTHEVGFMETSLKQVLRGAGFDKVEMRGDHSPARNRVRRLVLRGARELLWGAMRLAMFVEGTGDMNPTILTKNLIGIGYKN